MAPDTDEPVASSDAELNTAVSQQSATVTETDQLITAIALLDYTEPNDFGDRSQPLGFSSLARELRNEVYRYLLPDSVRVKPGPADYAARSFPRTAFTIAPFYSPSLLLVSRQFKKEYTEEAFLGAQASLTVVGNYLDVGKRLPSTLPHNILARLKHFEIRVDLRASGVNQWPRAHKTMKNQIRNLINLLPALQTLSLVFHGSLRGLQTALGRHNQTFKAKDLFAVSTLMRPGGNSTKLRTTLLLDAPLCAFGPGIAAYDPLLLHWLTNHCNNHITYRATPTDDPLAVAGLDFNTESGGVFDYEAAVQEHRGLVGFDSDGYSLSDSDYGDEIFVDYGDEIYD